MSRSRNLGRTDRATAGRMRTNFWKWCASERGKHLIKILSKRREHSQSSDERPRLASSQVGARGIKASLEQMEVLGGFVSRNNLENAARETNASRRSSNYEAAAMRGKQ